MMVEVLGGYKDPCFFFCLILCFYEIYLSVFLHGGGEHFRSTKFPIVLHLKDYVIFPQAMALFSFTDGT